MPEDFKQLLKDHILDEANFVRAEFKGQRRGATVAWQKVTLRPVQIKGERRLQVSYFVDNKDITKNFSRDQASETLDDLLAQPFKNYQVESLSGKLHVQITKKGKAIIHHDQTAGPAAKPMLAHDRQKAHLLSGERSTAFLTAIGIMTEQGRIKADMRRKLSQINEFLRLIDETVDAAWLQQRDPVRVVDFGCGNGTLTYGVYHYLTDLLGLPTSMTGLDLKADLMARHQAQSRVLGWDGLCFEPGQILEFHSDHPADMVLALHACDTATDEALARAIGWQSRYIFAAPCCHHHLQQQLRAQEPPPEFRAGLRHGILRERLGDLLTDTFRAAILRLLGYRTEVVEFVSSEHTAKNLLIRAVSTNRPGDPQAVQEYVALKEYWQVTPYLETLLGEKLARFL
ncbi:MAG: SAM-dependent methyltransferase [Anaerolineae bacterium]|nr:SAM-dependent methyltransferase [Anaerolineae bacterium]